LESGLVEVICLLVGTFLSVEIDLWVVIVL